MNLLVLALFPLLSASAVHAQAPLVHTVRPGEYL
jgi:hypothetical protein